MLWEPLAETTQTELLQKDPLTWLYVSLFLGLRAAEVSCQGWADSPEEAGSPVPACSSASFLMFHVALL